MNKGGLPGPLVEPEVVKVGKQWEVDDGEWNVSAGEEETLRYPLLGGSHPRSCACLPMSFIAPQRVRDKPTVPVPLAPVNNVGQSVREKVGLPPRPLAHYSALPAPAAISAEPAANRGWRLIQ